MKPFIRTIFIWILSLSLTGFPVVALSQNVAGDMAGLGQTDKDGTTTLSKKSASGSHCHENMAQNKTPQININQTAKTSQASPHAMHIAASSGETSSHDCCCGDDCQCQHDMACQSVGHFGASSAILQSILLVSSPINSQLTTEFTILYHDCDADSEVIPPIS